MPTRGEFLGRLAGEVRRQPQVLEEFSKSRLPRAAGGSIFVGAGDSYAACLAAFYASRAGCVALDPYELAARPEIATGREVFFVSASGRTSSNIAAARKVSGLAKQTTLLTADEKSELAAVVDRTIGLPMQAVPRTPGLLSFSLSLLAVLKISTGDTPCDFARVYRRAEVDCSGVAIGRGTTYFLGNLAGYALSVYSAAKVYEFFGKKAHAEMLEEFSHMELFSLNKRDAVNIFTDFDPSGVGKRLHHALEGAGYETHLVPSWGATDLERVFHCVFAAQLAVLGKAEADGLLRPRFLTARNHLEISDAMIY